MVEDIDSGDGIETKKLFFAVPPLIQSCQEIIRMHMYVSPTPPFSPFENEDYSQTTYNSDKYPQKILRQIRILFLIKSAFILTLSFFPFPS